MSRRAEATAFVFPFWENGQEYGRLFCSAACGTNTLEDPPVCWDPFRLRVAHRLAVAIVCEGCDLTIAEAQANRGAVR